MTWNKELEEGGSQLSGLLRDVHSGKSKKQCKGPEVEQNWSALVCTGQVLELGIVSEDEGLGDESQEVTGGQLPLPGLKGERRQGAQAER